MLHQRISIPSSDSYQVSLDMYVPNVSKEIDLNILRPAIVICPGGGYEFLSEREAEPIALRFLLEGFNTFVVWYRVSPNRYPRPVQDVAAAVAYVRTHADELHTRKDAIAVMGFSAGGHVAGSLGVRWPQAELWQPLGLTAEDVKPNAMALCYPVITGGPYAHRGSFINLTGSDDLSEHEKQSLEKLAGPHCPPTFLWHTIADDCVPFENSLIFVKVLKDAGVSVDLKLEQSGGHGLSLCNKITGNDTTCSPLSSMDWPDRCAKFLRREMHESW